MFKGFLILHPIDNSSYWKVLASISYITDNNNIIIIPKGFNTNFASTPRIIWSILPPWDSRYGKPAILHDYLYYSNLYTKRESDLIFFEAMKNQNVSKWKRYSMYYAVKFFGFICWNKHRKMEKKKCQNQKIQIQ
jgi:hypothetical protein